MYILWCILYVYKLLMDNIDKHFLGNKCKKARIILINSSKHFLIYLPSEYKILLVIFIVFQCVLCSHFMCSCMSIQIRFRLTDRLSSPCMRNYFIWTSWWKKTHKLHTAIPLSITTMSLTWPPIPCNMPSFYHSN